TLGADLIVNLVTAGRRVGVTATSHKVIGQLLAETAECARKRGVTVRIGQVPARGEEPTCADAVPLDNAGARDALAAPAGDPAALDVVGGTAWLWSREEMAGAVDTLFVDEAGQISLANVVAAAGAARNLVLLGDPQQLDQPIQGSHPPGADRSALAHLLTGPGGEEHQTMPPTLGLFLDGSYRLHPEIARVTSELFYEGRLRAHPGREAQRILGDGPLAGSGVRFVPVHHAGNDSASREEAEAVATLIAELLRSHAQWVDHNGQMHTLEAKDVLVITPYNAQVRELLDVVPDGVRVGTVDKFQGQQAPLAIYSMATSSADEAPRGMEFLYSLNRLNVATSRAKCVAAVVASPDLLRVRCKTPRQMRLANALARVIEVG
ncbi:MAG: AAA domain-containing protein, partial [Chloroflexi bacterium]|nr:AAA domain-containing protein [Chloroflexota bacterium]